MHLFVLLAYFGHLFLAYFYLSNSIQASLYTIKRRPSMSNLTGIHGGLSWVLFKFCSMLEWILDTVMFYFYNIFYWAACSAGTC